MTPRVTALFAFLAFAAIPLVHESAPAPITWEQRLSDQHKREISAWLSEWVRWALRGQS